MLKRICLLSLIAAGGVACDPAEPSSIVVDRQGELAGVDVAQPDFTAPPRPDGPPGIDAGIAAAVRTADLAFIGEVTRVEFAVSAAGEDAIEVPHTFVTYAVERGFKGAAADEVTLRFAGGPTRNGLFLNVSGLPRFQVGDRDLLFVQDNGLSACPLVECTRGRLRLVDGGVFTDGARELVVDDAGRALIGALDDREALTTSQVGDRQLRRETVVSPELEALHADLGRPLAEQELAQRVERSLELARQAGELATRPAFRSADPRRPFTIPAPVQGGFAGQAPVRDRGAPLPTTTNPPAKL